MGDIDIASQAADKTSTALATAPIAGPFVWQGRDLAHSRAWVRNLTAPELADIDAALRAAARRGLALYDVTKGDFALTAAAELLAELGRELETGRGFVLLRGLPVARYSVDELRLIFWGLGTHLGTAVSQSKAGELLGEVRDIGVRMGEPTSRGYRSRDELRFHTDRCDVVGLLSARKAKAGGLSRITSSVAVHNEIWRRRPDLLALLKEDYHHGRQGEEAPDEQRYYVNPVFGLREGRFTSQFSRSYIESAQRFPEVPRLTAAQIEALDLLAALANELCLEMELEPGDIQLLNNHVIYHARTSYEDYAEAERQRLLLRLWLAVPESRALPEGCAALWGRTEAGAVRGGVRAQAGYRDIIEYRHAHARH
jgi:hypothetical protein